MAPSGVSSAQVRQAIIKVQALSDANWSALREAIQLMNDEAWVGPTGARYTRTLQGQQMHMQAAFRQALEELNSLYNKALKAERDDRHTKQNG